ncbi:NUDIX hydrolase [Clostridium thermobutyricum]
MESKWLTWAKELQSIAQAGEHYSKDKFDIERFNRIREISVEILNEYTDIDNEKIRDLFCNEKGYQTPKVDVRGVVFKDGKILLVQEQIDNKWALPGGWAEYNLSLKENVEKEIFEEAGIKAKAKSIIAIHQNSKHSERPSAYGVYKVFILCEYISGEFIENIETSKSWYFTLEKLPELSLGRNNRSQLEMCFNWISEDKRETQFD